MNSAVAAPVPILLIAALTVITRPISTMNRTIIAGPRKMLCINCGWVETHQATTAVSARPEAIHA